MDKHIKSLIELSIIIGLLIFGYSHISNLEITWISILAFIAILVGGVWSYRIVSKL